MVSPGASTPLTRPPLPGHPPSGVDAGGVLPPPLPLGRSHARQYAPLYVARLKALTPAATAAAAAAWPDVSLAPSLLAAAAAAAAAGVAAATADANSLNKPKAMAAAAVVSAAAAAGPLGVRKDDPPPPSSATAVAARARAAAGDVDAGVDVAVVVLLLKITPKRPSLLAAYASSRRSLVPPPPDPPADGISPDDVVVVEDASSRARADVSALRTPVSRLPTGVVVAVRGRVVAATGAFRVVALAPPGVPPPPPRLALPTLPPLAATEVCLPGDDDLGFGTAGDPHVLILGGLRLGPDGGGAAVAALLAFLRGDVGGPAAARAAASVAALVLAGDSVAGAPASADGDGDADAAAAAAAAATAAGLPALDAFLAAAGAALPVAILPGPGDPGPALLPSPPLHRALLPAAAASAGVTRLPAPGVYTVGGRPLLGVAAGALADHGRYVRGGGGVTGLATLLTHRCVAPTTPDTLGVVPTEGVDPVVLAGGGFAAAYALSTEWGVGEVGGVVTVTVPPFAEGGVVAALNLNTMAVRPLRFGCGLGG